MQDNFHRPDDHEAKMARADLFKCAQYSFKLFKMIQEDQELEGWVQAKITKAADYIASVYHYMEYEMKISEYGSAIENSDMYSESIRRAFTQKLTEAKKQAVKAKDAMKKREEDLDEESDNSPFNWKKPRDAGDGDYEKKSSTGGTTKKKGNVTTHTHNPDRFNDEPYDSSKDRTKTHAKSRSAAEKAGDKAYDKAQEKDSRAWGKANPGKQTIMKGGVKTTNEGAKPDFLDMDKDGDKKEPMKKAVADKKKNPFVKEGTCSVCKKNPCVCNVKESVGKCNHTPKGEKCPVHGLKECSGMYEASHQEKTTMKHVNNPTAGEKAAAKDIKPGVKGYADRVAMLKSAEADGRLKKESTGDYSAKKAAAGKDIGKPGKNFSKIEKSAGGGEKGKKIAGAVLAKLRAKG